MLKSTITLEFNSKKDVLGQIELKTPSEFMFASNTEQIVNCSILEDFIDDMFTLITEEFVYEFREKIDNVYVTFMGEDGTFICSIVIDKLNPKKQRYRIRTVDWQSSGYTFRYENDGYDSNNDLKSEF